MVSCPPRGDQADRVATHREDNGNQDAFDGTNRNLSVFDFAVPWQQDVWVKQDYQGIG